MPRPPWHRGGGFRTRPRRSCSCGPRSARADMNSTPALEDLSRLLEKDPRDPQAWLMQAVVLIVRADYQAARQACEALARLRRAFLAFSCMGSLASLSGQARGRLRSAPARRGPVAECHAGRAGEARDAARQDRRTSGRLGARRGPFPGGAEARPPRCLSPRGVRGFPPRPRARGRGGRATPRRDAGRWSAPAPDPGRARESARRGRRRTSKNCGRALRRAGSAAITCTRVRRPGFSCTSSTNPRRR